MTCNDQTTAWISEKSILISLCSMVIVAAVSLLANSQNRFDRQFPGGIRICQHTQQKTITELTSKPLSAGQLIRSGVSSSTNDRWKLSSSPISPAAPDSDAIPQAPDGSACTTVAPNTVTNGLALVDREGQPISPSSVVNANSELYFLAPDCLWQAKREELAKANTSGRIVLDKITAPKLISKVPRQEFMNLCCLSKHQALIVLDKSGDLFEYWPSNHSWRIFRTNLPFLSGQPDPDFVDLCGHGSEIALLDPERNDIWLVPGQTRVLPGLFPAVLPWKTQPGEPNVGDAVAIAFDSSTYVLKRFGTVTKYDKGADSLIHQSIFAYKRPQRMRPTRLLTAIGTPLFIVERSNNRVISIDKQTKKTRQFLFPAQSDLRGLLPLSDGFWIINGDHFEHRQLTQEDSARKRFTARPIDSRLDGFVLPVAGMRLPRHPGVFPGARRLYRYGVHEGLDLFHDAGAKSKIQMGTAVRAADGGKVARADAHFRDMNAAKFARVMWQCCREHRTSPENEDLLRGCQVWIDHGNQLVTRYAHLSKISAELRVGQFVEPGALVGFVGISGTGQDLPGRIKFPHLHFEIWLDGKYLGWGLTPAETMSIYEDVFGHSNNE